MILGIPHWKFLIFFDLQCYYYQLCEEAEAGKSDSGVWLPDHVIEAQPCFHALLVLYIYSVSWQCTWFTYRCHFATYSKGLSKSSNYCGIALAPSLSKVLEWSILWPGQTALVHVISSLVLRMDFPLLSVATSVLKAFVNRYVRGNSSIMHVI